jgi:hypothetical protein
MPVQELTGNDILDALELTVDAVAHVPNQNALKVLESLIKEQEAAYAEV